MEPSSIIALGEIIVKNVKDWLSRNPIEEDRKALYNKVKKYHAIALEIYERNEKATKLADALKKDDLLKLVIGHNEVENLVSYLVYLDDLLQSPERKVRSFQRRKEANNVVTIFRRIWHDIFKQA